MQFSVYLLKPLMEVGHHQTPSQHFPVNLMHLEKQLDNLHM